MPVTSRLRYFSQALGWPSRMCGSIAPVFSVAHFLDALQHGLLDDAVADGIGQRVVHAGVPEQIWGFQLLARLLAYLGGGCARLLEPRGRQVHLQGDAPGRPFCCCSIGGFNESNYLFPAYELNHSYHDCDVFVSMAKLKEHETTGITLSMKNCFGITPCSIYGTTAGIDDPDENPKGGRGLLHGGNRQPSKIPPQKRTRRLPGKAVIEFHGR